MTAEPTRAELRRRLAALREALAADGLDGLLLPSADEFQNEFVPPEGRRLAWLTGFTGSLGVAVVLAGRAALFVDGRYTLQAREQVDSESFELVHLVERPPADWLRAELAAGTRLAFDARLHTAEALAKLHEAVAAAGGEAVHLEANPVDRLWSGRPAPSKAPLEAHDERYAGWSAAAKRAAVAEEIAAAGAEAAVIGEPASVAWLLNVRGRDVPHTPLPLATAVVHADARTQLYVDPDKVDKALADHLGPEVAVRPLADFAAGLAALGQAGRAVAVDRAHVNAWTCQALERAGAKLVFRDDPVALRRACKNATELDGARAAHLRDGAAMVRFLAWLDEAAAAGGLTETAAAERLRVLRAEDPLFRDLSFPTISAAGPHAAIPHYQPSAASDRALDPGTLYLVDSGGQYLDGTTDITRTVAVGAPTAEMRRRFTLVLKGHIAIATLRFPHGTTGEQIDAFARRHLWAEGLDYDHGTGHGVGSYLGVHEGPQRIARSGRARLEAGMIVSNEPGCYEAGAYGIRIENLVIVCDCPELSGEARRMLAFETVTACPIDRRLVEPGLLSAEERDWLERYHAWVRGALVPRLEADAAARAWLEAATAPLAG